MTIHRLTLFKIPREEDLPTLLAQFQLLQGTALKDNEPYIISVQAGATMPDARSQGYTLAVRTVFRSLEDMRYYDTECEAHQALKRLVMDRREGNPLAVYFEDIMGN